MKRIIITSNSNFKAGRKQEVLFVNLPFEITISGDKNNQICDIQPKVVKDIDLFSKYHGRTITNYGLNLIEELKDLM